MENASLCQQTGIFLSEEISSEWLNLNLAVFDQATIEKVLSQLHPVGNLCYIDTVTLS